MSLFTANALPITSTFAGYLAIAFVVAAILVIMSRLKENKMYGAEKGDLMHRNRAHGTIAENAPFGLLLLALLEYNSVVSPRLLWWWGFAFTVLRVSHATQLAFPKALPTMVFRGVPFLLTLTLLTTASVLLIHSASRV